jgi:formiminotetrahydrofolate cyclodeaminase
MVANITASAKRFEPSHPRATEIAAEADALRAQLEAARRADEAAYAAVAEAMKLPKATEAEKHDRHLKLQAALNNAAEAPLAIARLSQQAATLCDSALTLGNDNLATDLACAALFAKAAAQAAAFNVRINHKYIEDTALTDDQSTKLTEIQTKTNAATDHVLAEVTRLL